MPLIRRLCHNFTTPPLIPHVYTGLCVVLGLADLDSKQDDDEDDTYRDDVTGLTLALFIMVLSKMQRGAVSSESYLADCERACTIAKEGEEEEGDSNLNPTKEAVDEWIKRISSEGWTTGQDWWGSVPEGVVDRVGELSAEEREVRHDEDEDDELVARKRRKMPLGDGARDPEGTLLPGLGTMMQESVDWLGEDRRADYLQWRAGIEMRLPGRTGRDVGRTRAKAKGITSR
jgi:origin recognition complex subunit 6